VTSGLRHYDFNDLW